MKSRIFIQGIICALLTIVPLWVGAESGSVAIDGSGGTVAQNGTALLLSGITVDDDMHIHMDFTQNIVVESVRIRIAKQSDGTNIKIDSLTGVLDKQMSVAVTLSDVLEAGEAYTMTVISALSDKGVTITAGTDALSEFSAPKALKQSLIVFNAPTNPVTTTATVTEPTATEEVTTVGANTKTELETPPTPANAELPLTGTNPVLFIIISGILALFLLLRRKA